MLTNFNIRQLKTNEIPLIYSWIREEEWNPGTYDVKTCHAIPSTRFYIGEKDGNIVSCISALTYQSNFAFIGYYVVRPQSLRGNGYGIATWNHVFDELISEGVSYFGLDGVIEQIPNYEKQGFKPTYLHQRHTYTITGNEKNDAHIRLEAPNLEELTALDSRFMPESRPGYIKAFLNHDPTRRHALVRTTNRQLQAYACLRQAAEGFRIGPVYAQNLDIAISLVRSLVAELPVGAQTFLDIPASNTNKEAFAEALKLSDSIFDCMRMYRGPTPDIPVNEVFAVANIEMG